jgi:hypothetical protein
MLATIAVSWLASQERALLLTQVYSGEGKRHMGLNSFLKRFLPSLSRIFGESFPIAELDPVVSRLETVCKYQLDRKELRSNGTVRHSAFMPASDGARSVFRILGLSDSETWNLGLEKVARVRNKPLLGRFDVNADLVYDQKLGFNADADRRSRHADIVGWPPEKEKQQSIAQILAAEARAIHSPH